MECKGMANPIKGAKASVTLMKAKAQQKGKTLSAGNAIKGAVKGALNPKPTILGAKLVKSANAMVKKTDERLKDPTVQAKLKALAPKK
jgi:hypothetical protein